VVSTKVGGVPEILPEDMIEFARADEEDVIRALSLAIRAVGVQYTPASASADGDAVVGGLADELTSGEGQWDRHERVKAMYDWQTVAERTEVVYRRVMDSDERDVGERLAR
jgi:phosphatidylinositol glycan class A protein